MDDMDGLEMIVDEDRAKITQMIERANMEREQPVDEATKTHRKIRSKHLISTQETAKARLGRLKSSLTPTIAIICSNADQLTTTKNCLS